jgi:hypothetical protein
VTIMGNTEGPRPSVATDRDIDRTLGYADRDEAFAGASGNKVRQILASCEAALLLMESMLGRRDFAARHLIDPLLDQCRAAQSESVLRGVSETAARHVQAAVAALEEAVQRTDCFIYSTDPEPSHGRELLAEATELLNLADRERRAAEALLPDHSSR